MAKTTTKPSDAAKLAKKAKKGTTHLALLLDESGSMEGNVEAVVSSVNEFLHTFEEAETKDSKIKVWLGMFDKQPGEPRVRIKVNGDRVGKVEKLHAQDYRPRGLTPLNDAVIETIEAMDEAVGKDERAFVVILTDGWENASENTAENVSKLIQKRMKRGWAFLYLGANVNAVQAAHQIGLSQQHALQFTSSPTGTRSAVQRTTSRAASYLASDSAEAYAVTASADWNRTKGVVPEEGEEEESDKA